MTRERISRILELRIMLPSFQTGLNHVDAAVICIVLESTSGTIVRHNLVQVLEACECFKLLSICFDLLVDVAGVVCHLLGLLRTDLNAVSCGSFVESLN